MALGVLPSRSKLLHPLSSFLLLCLSCSLVSASLLDIGRGGRSRAEGSSGGDAGVVRCSFVSGLGGSQKSPLSSFFVPANDRAMYEEGLKDYLQQIGAQPSELSVICTPYVSSEPVACQLCLYNEVSRDLKHVRQGQVLSSLLPQCMQGSFEQAFKMPMSQYHPICYPDDKSTELIPEPQMKQVAQHGGDSSCNN